MDAIRGTQDGRLDVVRVHGLDRGQERPLVRVGTQLGVDEDGFLFLTDRLSRFSKIGGEMVPHIKVEEKLHEIAEVTVQTFAVTSLPDAKKGEKLMVLHTVTETHLETVLEKLGTADLPNLWKPKRDQFVKVDALPVLGTGKTDLRKVKEVAAAADGGMTKSE